MVKVAGMLPPVILYSIDGALRCVSATSIATDLVR